jgi:POT family proton-dependent oligopeptide transporter
MAIGHFLMAIQPAFLIALLALLLGVGAFKGNIATQVGALYGPNDLRRAMAFQIFYIFINVSVIAGPLISGTLGQKVGWHWGFGCAGVVMVLGLIIYLSGRKYLPAESGPQRTEAKVPREPLTRDDWIRLVSLLILIPVLAVSLLTNQEIFNAYLVWGDERFDLTFFGTTFPSTWLITLDAAVSFSMLVAVAAFWKWWGTRHREPDEVSKMIIGSIFTIAGGLALFMAALTTPATEKVGLGWILVFEFMNSIGFAHILPISLALFSKISPKQITSTVIGLYYLGFFLANAVVGWVGGLYSSLPTTTFWLIHVASAVFGLVAFVVFKLVLGHRMTAGVEEQSDALS